MALAPINDNIQLNAGKALDNRYMAGGVTPYTSLAAARTAIPISRRSIGLAVNILNDEYWWKDGIEDDDLILKQTGGGGGDSNIDGGNASSIYTSIPNIDGGGA